jgi:hypothetical protein
MERLRALGKRARSSAAAMDHVALGGARPRGSGSAVRTRAGRWHAGQGRTSMPMRRSIRSAPSAGACRARGWRFVSVGESLVRSGGVWWRGSRSGAHSVEFHEAAREYVLDEAREQVLPPRLGASRKS